MKIFSPITKTLLVVSVSLTIFLLQPAALADVKVVGQNSGKGIGQMSEGMTVTYIKGSKMRSDQLARDAKSTILDADGGKMILLDHKKKEAQVTDIRDISEALGQVSEGGVQAQLKPTGRTRQMLGQPVEEYQVTIRIPFSPVPDQTIDMVMSGPAWIAPDSPGREDYARFYLAAAEKGLFFGDPRAAKAQPGPAKGMTTLYKLLAEAGVPYSMDMMIAFEGSGMMAALMSKMGGASFANTVTEISVEPLSDSLFEIPAGYKVKKR